MSRLMALALKFDRLLRERKLDGFAHIARLGHVSRARLSQIMSLLNLAPAIQETLLLLPKTFTRRDPVTEHHLRRIAHVIDWEQQRRMFQELMQRERRLAGHCSD